jgi:hypothetical protein
MPAPLIAAGVAIAARLAAKKVAQEAAKKVAKKAAAKAAAKKAATKKASAIVKNLKNTKPMENVPKGVSNRFDATLKKQKAETAFRAAKNKALANSAKGKLQTPTAEAARRRNIKK